VYDIDKQLASSHKTRVERRTFKPITTRWR
jgi:hypothetical protein